MVVWERGEGVNGVVVWGDAVMVVLSLGSVSSYLRSLGQCAMCDVQCRDGIDRR